MDGWNEVLLENCNFLGCYNALKTKFGENFLNAPSKYFRSGDETMEVELKATKPFRFKACFLHKKKKYNRFYESEDFFGWFWCQIVLKWWYNFFFSPSFICSCFWLPSHENIRNTVHSVAGEQSIVLLWAFQRFSFYFLFFFKKKKITRSNYFLFGLGSVRFVIATICICMSHQTLAFK